jgi:hypothetical protein
MCLRVFGRSWSIVFRWWIHLPVFPVAWCRTEFPMAPFLVSCRYFVDTSRASVRRTNVRSNPTRSGKSVGHNLPYDKSCSTEHRDGSLSEPHLTPTAAAGLTKTASGIVLHAAQQVVRGELNVCLVSWQHVICAAHLLNRGNCSGPSTRFCTHDACNSANGMSNRSGNTHNT